MSYLPVCAGPPFPGFCDEQIACPAGTTASGNFVGTQVFSLECYPGIQACESDLDCTNPPEPSSAGFCNNLNTCYYYTCSNYPADVWSTETCGCVAAPPPPPPVEPPVSPPTVSCTLACECTTVTQMSYLPYCLGPPFPGICDEQIACPSGSTPSGNFVGTQLASLECFPGIQACESDLDCTNPPEPSSVGYCNNLNTCYYYTCSNYPADVWNNETCGCVAAPPPPPPVEPPTPPPTATCNVSCECGTVTEMSNLPYCLGPPFPGICDEQTACPSNATASGNYVGTQLASLECFPGIQSCSSDVDCNNAPEPGSVGFCNNLNTCYYYTCSNYPEEIWDVELCGCIIAPPVAPTPIPSPPPVVSCATSCECTYTSQIAHLPVCVGPPFPGFCDEQIACPSNTTASGNFVGIQIFSLQCFPGIQSCTVDANCTNPFVTGSVGFCSNLNVCYYYGCSNYPDEIWDVETCGCSAAPPVEPPVSPPVSPPIEPPVSPPVEPPVSPPVSPPISPPVEPPISPPVPPPLIIPPGLIIFIVVMSTIAVTMLCVLCWCFYPVMLFRPRRRYTVINQTPRTVYG